VYSPESRTGTAAFVVREPGRNQEEWTVLLPLTWCVRSDPLYPSGLEGDGVPLGDSDWLIDINAYRMGWHDPARSRTRIKLQPDWLRDLPPWAIESRSAADALVRAKLLQALEDNVLAQTGRTPPGARLRASFSTPPPKGPNVPVGDALALVSMLRAHAVGPIALDGVVLPGDGGK